MSGYFFNGAGGGGADLWKFIGGGNDDIELNDTGAGVTGIQAPLPDDKNIFLALTDVNPVDGNPGAGVGFIDLVSGFSAFSGLTGHPGAYAIKSFLNNLATCEQCLLQFDNPNMTIELTTIVGLSRFSIIIDQFRFAVAFNGVDVFAVDIDGHIRTNQLQAGAPAAPLAYKKIPIYDNAGVFQGYIPVFLT